MTYGLASYQENGEIRLVSERFDPSLDSVLDLELGCRENMIIMVSSDKI